MAPRTGRRDRQRGEIEALPSGSLRVTVYAGQDPLTKRRLRLREIVPAGPDAAAQAEKALRRMVVEMDEQRNPRTAATVAQLLAKHFELLEIEPKTLVTYRSIADRHIVPLLGTVKVGELRANVFDSFYAELRRCRAHCDRRPHVDHRTERPHECDGRCRMHTCRPLSRSTIRQAHVILSGALKRAVRWRWIASNPIEHAEAPPQPIAQPRPPTAAEAARILNDAWRDPDWAVLVWLTMVTGSRRGELCALRWRDIDLDAGAVSVERAIAQLGATKWVKDTKTHRGRRLALDLDTVALLAAHMALCTSRAAAVDVALSPEAFVFSPVPDGSQHLNPESVGQRYSALAQQLRGRARAVVNRGQRGVLPRGEPEGRAVGVVPLGVRQPRDVSEVAALLAVPPSSKAFSSSTTSSPCQRANRAVGRPPPPPPTTTTSASTSKGSSAVVGPEDSRGAMDGVGFTDGSFDGGVVQDDRAGVVFAAGTDHVRGPTSSATRLRPPSAPSTDFARMS